MLHAFARIASLVFHPLLMLTYTLVFLLAVNPYLFGVNHIGDPSSRLLLLRVFLSSCFIPAVAILMLRFTGLLRSLEMPSQQDRIAPFVITGMFYLWLFRNFLDNGQIPPLFSSFTLGATVTLFLAFLINIFSKISVHAAGMGGLLGVIILTLTIYPNYAFTQILPSGSLPFSLSMHGILLSVIVLAGLVGSSRLLLRHHEPMDLWGGYLMGFIGQFIAARFIL
ncbi:MAG: hypothetical protein IPN74_14635 [Haliscomenobacter sp.]|nr:hypothetical protein [Haliscomenobacter sp.]